MAHICFQKQLKINDTNKGKTLKRRNIITHNTNTHTAHTSHIERVTYSRLIHAFDL